jgi:hypothetical protein
MVGVKVRVSCEKYFGNLIYLMLASEYIFYPPSFEVEALETSRRNADAHTLMTRQKYDVHKPNTTLTKYQGGVCKY